MGGQHTPGPWEAESVEGGALNERPWVGRLAESRYSALSCGETQGEAVANARLIAAAPELLEACLKAAPCLADETTPEVEWNAALASLRAAIAKATGAA